jgi:hypothetical protein
MFNHFFYAHEIEDRETYCFCPVCHSVILSSTKNFNLGYTGDAYSSLEPDPTSGISRGPCSLTCISYLFLRLITLWYLSRIMY